VPVAITCSLIKKAMEANGWEAKKYLVDGFPRNEDNYTGWQAVMKDIVSVPIVFWFDVSEEVLEQRILERSKTSGRNDDNPETLRKRFRQFTEEGMPVINRYAEQGIVRKINGAQPVEKVFEDVKHALAGYI
jgi:UMP-CMP kinase